MLNKIHDQYMCYSDTFLILSGTMTLSSYCQTEVPEDILDGIFSDQEMLQWKLGDKSCTEDPKLIGQAKCIPVKCLILLKLNLLIVQMKAGNTNLIKVRKLF